MEMISMVVGGLGLFLFGMSMMTDGLKAISGNKLRKMLESVTRRPLMAVTIGALVTCLIQSSSATTVMTVGFVNAGLLTLKQALGVVLGANIGTTLTAWLVSGISVLKITSYALPAVALGFLMQLACKTQRNKNIGSIILGFGILFIGIGFMKDAFGPLKHSARALEILAALGDKPIYAVLAGTVITVMLQSSSASIAMIQLLAFQGAFGSENWVDVLRITIPFILGDNIGTTITAQIAALRTSRNAKRTAMGHTIFNVIGVLYVMIFVQMGWFDRLVLWICPGKLTQNTIMLHLAVAHTTFNLVNTIIFVPLIGLLEKIVLKIIPVRGEELEQKPVTLEEHLLETPELALAQANRATVAMTQRCRKAFKQAMEGLVNNDRKAMAKALKSEDMIDDYQEQITSYLVNLSTKKLSQEASSEIPVLLHTVNDLERVGDHAKNIVEIAERKTERKIVFSDFAMTEVTQLKSEVYQMLDSTIVALENKVTDKGNSASKDALENEKNLNKMQVDFRKAHVLRMSDGRCPAQTGILFIDVVDNIEKIGDHLTNVVQNCTAGLDWNRAD